MKKDKSNNKISDTDKINRLSYFIKKKKAQNMALEKLIEKINTDESLTKKSK
jgi:hypothetical protein